MDFIENMNKALSAFDTLPSYELKLTLLCTMFDHICETHNKDKSAELAKMCVLIAEVNGIEGDMYAGKEN